MRELVLTDQVVGFPKRESMPLLLLRLLLTTSRSAIARSLSIFLLLSIFRPC
jgi:hypothetical protein